MKATTIEAHRVRDGDRIELADGCAPVVIRAAVFNGDRIRFALAERGSFSCAPTTRLRRLAPRQTLGDALDRALGAPARFISHNCERGFHQVCLGDYAGRTCDCDCSHPMITKRQPKEQR